MYERVTQVGPMSHNPASIIATTLVLVITLSGCDLLGGSDEERASSPTGAGGLERTDITVSVMKTTDLAPFHLAITQGYFEEEGLHVSFIDAANGGASVARLASGEVDLAYASYTPFFLAQAKGAVPGGVTLVAEASSAGPGSAVVVALPDSSVTGVEDMAHTKVAVTARGTISDLLLMSTLKTHGIDYTTIDWVPTPFPHVAAQLKAGHVDAAVVTEPWIRDAAEKADAVAVFDVATGPTADMPTAGFGARTTFVDEHPNTIAAFQRVMQKATAEALGDRRLVEPLLEAFANIDEETAKAATLLTFRSRLDTTRIQRVPDLMLQFGVLQAPIDVSTMIVPSAAPAS